MTWARFGAVLQDHDVAVADVAGDQGIAEHAQGEAGGGWFNADHVDVHRQAGFVLLGSLAREAGGDGTEDGNGGAGWG